MIFYVVAWTGGYEAPSYAACLTRDLAIQKAEEWAELMDEGVDTIDLLEIDTAKMSVERVEGEKFA